MNKGRMTFRFDEHGRESNSSQGPVNQDRYITDEASLEAFNVDNEDLWNNSYRVVEQNQDWGDPFTDYTETGGTMVPAYSVTSPRTSWWKVAGSITGAIVTGALFGFVVLSLFNQEVTFPVPGIGTSKQSAEGGAADIPVIGQISEETALLPAEEIVTKVEVRLPVQTYHFLQYGVFSTAEGVELAQKELQDSGIAAARDTVDTKRVYAGVSTDREQAKLLSSQLKSAGVHLILHEISLPASANVEYDGDKSHLERYLTQSAELVKQLSASSASRLVESEPKMLSSDETKTLGESHQQWTESAAAVRGHLSSALETNANEMEKAINSAVEAMGEYNKKGAKTLLWEVQNEIMRYIMAQQSMLQ
ncbi:stage II sporulation protein B [Fontibacillus panacisegetis]|uniref:Stage II sporulation protein B n=1 Tax=Fontibacillus panacisegetis TaxID=670482 RepID=A0A1G7JM14_9BACL|nr:SPOR domain-containing protein [Fontibacillus panacisegetis]SDF25943.1 stage II sporulation protein B [Fontibacillus panacisegetis]